MIKNSRTIEPRKKKLWKS